MTFARGVVACREIRFDESWLNLNREITRFRKQLNLEFVISRQAKAYRTSTNQHRSGAFVGEDFREKRVAVGATDDVCAVDAAT